jgi:hypothetical protein
MADNKTTYFEKMMGGGMQPNSIVVLSNSPLDSTIIIFSYFNFLFRFIEGLKVELWEDRSWLDLSYFRMLKNYIGNDIKHYRPVKLIEREKDSDIGIRKLYDEFVLRRSNRHAHSKRIIYLETVFIAGLKPRNVMVEEILKDGGQKCGIQFVAETSGGFGGLDEGLLRQFDIRIAFTPLKKKDSIALFDSDEYATSKKEDYILFGYKDKVDKVPIYKHDLTRDSGDKFLELIRTWSF